MIPEATITTANGVGLVKAALDNQREFFGTQVTKAVDFRVAQLKKLRQAIVKHEKALLAALKLDLGKHEFESYGTEIGYVLNDIDHTLRHIKKWTRPKRVATPFMHFKASSKIYKDPYGIVLIIAPWNYPFQLLFAPLVGAMGAGNCVVVKPSEMAPHTSKVCAQIITETFEPHYIAVFEGGIPMSKELLAHKFDYIFFTGSTTVGKIVYQAAAKNLTPVTLELGGKSPCIIGKDADLTLGAKRMMWGKLINAGQTCIAPDYVLVHESVKDDFIQAVKKTIQDQLGKDSESSKYYGRIINKRHLERLENLAESGGTVVYGGEVNYDTLYMSPTLIDGVSDTDAVMQEEIFGPILPIMTYSNSEEVVSYVNAHAKPLALYVFCTDQSFIDKILQETSSGGVCINDTIVHMANGDLPFGGVGDSGLGAYHGLYSFDTFSHAKSVTHRSNKIDPPLRYAPYKLTLGLLKRFYGKLMR